MQKNTRLKLLTYYLDSDKFRSEIKRAQKYFIDKNIKYTPKHMLEFFKPQNDM